MPSDKYYLDDDKLYVKTGVKGKIIVNESYEEFINQKSRKYLNF